VLGSLIVELWGELLGMLENFDLMYHWYQPND
jgi:hypothetical protein